MRAAALVLVLAAVSATCTAYGLKDTNLRGQQSDGDVFDDAPDGHMNLHLHRFLAGNSHKTCKKGRLERALKTHSASCPPLKAIMDTTSLNTTIVQLNQMVANVCKKACGQQADKMSSEWRESCAAKKPSSLKRNLPSSSKDEDDETTIDMAGDLSMGLTVFGCSKASSGDYCASLFANWDNLNAKNECPFTKSCCFGEWAKWQYPTTEMIEPFDRDCPGAKKAASTSCSAKST